MSILLLLALLLAALFFLWRRRTTACWNCLIFCCVYIILIGSGIIPTLLLMPLEKSYSYDATKAWKSNNVIILLGGGTASTPETDHVLPHTNAFSRIDRTAALYFSCAKEHRCKILISGGFDKTTKKTEAEIYQKILYSLGVPSDDILLEKESKNTRQNACYSGKMLRKIKADQVILVTSAIHLKRALLWFKLYEIDAIPVASDYQISKKTIMSFGYNFALVDFALHEYLGIIQFYLGLYVRN